MMRGRVMKGCVKEGLGMGCAYGLEWAMGWDERKTGRMGNGWGEWKRHEGFFIGREPHTLERTLRSVVGLREG